MPTQMPLTPLTAQQIADRLARLADLDLELEELDAAKAAFNEADKDQRKPIVKERAYLLAQIRETRAALEADADRERNNVSRPRFDRAE